MADTVKPAGTDDIMQLHGRGFSPERIATWLNTGGPHRKGRWHASQVAAVIAREADRETAS